MYRIADIDQYNFMVGKKIESAVIEAYMCRIQLAGETMITCENAIAINGNVVQLQHENAAMYSEAISPLVGATISSISQLDDFSILMRLDTGGSVALIGDDGDYESYTITNGEDTHIV